MSPTPSLLLSSRGSSSSDIGGHSRGQGRQALLHRRSKIALRGGSTGWDLEALCIELVQVTCHESCLLPLDEAVKLAQNQPGQCQLDWAGSALKVEIYAALNHQTLSLELVEKLRLAESIAEARVWGQLGLRADGRPLTASSETCSSFYMKHYAKARKNTSRKHVTAKCQGLQLYLHLVHDSPPTTDELVLYPHLRLGYTYQLNLALTSFLRRSLLSQVCIRQNQHENSASLSFISSGLVSKLAHALSALSGRMKNEESVAEARRSIRRCAAKNGEDQCETCSRTHLTLSDDGPQKVLEEALYQRLDSRPVNLVKWAAIHSNKRKAISTSSLASSLSRPASQDGEILREEMAEMMDGEDEAMESASEPMDRLVDERWKLPTQDTRCDENVHAWLSSIK